MKNGKKEMSDKEIFVEIEAYENNIQINFFHTNYEGDEGGGVNSNDVQVVLDDVVARLSHLIKNMKGKELRLAYRMTVKDDEDGIQLLQE